MTRKFVTCLKGRTLIQIDGGTYITPMHDKDEATGHPDFPDETTADQFLMRNSLGLSGIGILHRKTHDK